MTDSIETPESTEEAFASLYERTGDIKDINTLLVPRERLAKAEAVIRQAKEALEQTNKLLEEVTQQLDPYDKAAEECCRVGDSVDTALTTINEWEKSK